MVQPLTCTAQHMTSKWISLMPEFSSSKIINHHFHVNNNKGDLGIGYSMIIGRDLMVQIGLTANFKHQFLQWGGATVHMKEPNSMIGQSNIHKYEMGEVFIQTVEPASTRKAT